MAITKDMKKGVCDDVYAELSGVKNKIVALRDKIARTSTADDEMVRLYGRHLSELAEQIDWKLQILAHACPYDWKGSSGREYEENIVSVGPVERMTTDFSGGYLGG